MYNKITQSLTFSPTGFSSEPPVPTSQKENTRGFVFFRLFRDCYAWFSLVLNSLVNERAILTLGFYVQKWNCLTVFSEQPLIRVFKEQLSLCKRSYVLYKKGRANLSLN